MGTKIHPTVGRVVHYTPAYASGAPKPDPLPALISYIHDDVGRFINIGGFDQDGGTFARTSVELFQEGDTLPESGGYASWMPYQVAQQAKADTSITSEEQGKVDGAVKRLDKVEGHSKAESGAAAKPTGDGGPKSSVDDQARAQAAGKGPAGDSSTDTKAATK